MNTNTNNPAVAETSIVKGEYDNEGLYLQFFYRLTVGDEIEEFLYIPFSAIDKIAKGESLALFGKRNWHETEGYEGDDIDVHHIMLTEECPDKDHLGYWYTVSWDAEMQMIFIVNDYCDGTNSPITEVLVPVLG